MAKFMSMIFGVSKVSRSTPSSPQSEGRAAPKDEIKPLGFDSPTSAAIENKPLELKRICMFKVLETYIAFQEIKHTPRNNELSKLFRDLSFIKTINEVMMPLGLIADNLHSILEDIRNHTSLDNITGLLNIDECLNATLPTNSVESEGAAVRSQHPYCYSKLELTSLQQLDPLVPLGFQDTNMALQRYLNIIGATKNDLYFDVRINKWISAALCLDAQADAQNELLSSNSPQPSGLSESAAAAASSAREERQSSSSSATPSAAPYASSAEVRDVEGSAPYTPHRDPPHLYKFQTELWNKITLERRRVDDDSLRDKTSLISLLKYYCITQIVYMYGDPSINKHGLVAFYSDLMGFQEKPTAQAGALFEELINFLDDIISDAIAESNKSGSSAEQGGESKASVHALWDIPKFSDCVNLHITNQGVSLQDLCCTEAEQILASAISAATVHNAPTFEQLKHECLYKIAQLIVKVTDPTLSAHAVHPQLLALHSTLYASTADRVLDTFDSYVQSLTEGEGAADTEANIQQLTLALAPILGAAESSATPTGDS